MAKIDAIGNLKCCRCRTDNPTSFYKAQSNLYANGYLPICKDCLNDLFIIYSRKYKSQRMAIKRICMSFDVYYSDEIFDKCKDNEDDAVAISDYMRRIGMPQNKGKTFDRTLNEGFSFFDGMVDDAPKKEEKPLTTIPDSIREKWGDGFSDEEYKELEKHYKYLKKSNPHSTEMQETFIMDLCYTRMKQMSAVKSDNMDNYNKLSDSYRKTYAAAGFKTTQSTDANNNDCWGQWMSMIGQYTPEEYYKDRKLYKDFDGLGDYFNRFVLRPMKNLMLGTNDRDKEYCVKDEEDDIDVDIS